MDYLVKKNIKELSAGIRVEVSSDKKNPGDFVLWKAVNRSDNFVWNSPWGLGRPGWHIECSAMSNHHLGGTFDIHGGGIDLLFPHHENEIAQTCSFDKNAKSANYWIHNGFLAFDGDKMSKSLGNILSVRQILEDFKGEVVRYALLSTHYRKQLDWHDEILKNAKNELNKMYTALQGFSFYDNAEPDKEFVKYLCDDFNIPGAVSVLHSIVRDINKTNNQKEKSYLQSKLYQSGQLIGIFNEEYEEWFDVSDDKEIDDLIKKRYLAKKEKNYILADEIRDLLYKKNVQIFDNSDGTTKWRKIKH